MNSVKVSFARQVVYEALMQGITLLEIRIPMVKRGTPSASSLVRNAFFTPAEKEMTELEIKAWFYKCRDRLVETLRINMYPQPQGLAGTLSEPIHQKVWELIHEPIGQDS